MFGNNGQSGKGEIVSKALALICISSQRNSRAHRFAADHILCTCIGQHDHGEQGISDWLQRRATGRKNAEQNKQPRDEQGHGPR